MELDREILTGEELRALCLAGSLTHEGLCEEDYTALLDNELVRNTPERHVMNFCFSGLARFPAYQVTGKKLELCALMQKAEKPALPLGEPLNVLQLRARSAARSIPAKTDTRADELKQAVGTRLQESAHKGDTTYIIFFSQHMYDVAWFEGDKLYRVGRDMPVEDVRELIRARAA